MKEAILYQKLPDGKVKCAVCNHRCVIKDGGRGICGVRENRGGTLFALNYGKAISAALDPIEKKPLYYFMPGTKIYSFAAVGCNFRCSWCQNWEISQSPKPNGPIAGIEVLPEDHVKRAIGYGCTSIAYTYSEPTIFAEYALDTMKLAKAAGLKNVWVTNGFMTRELLDEIIPYLDAASVNFKGPNSGVYEEYCGGPAGPIMENLKHLYEADIHLEIITLIIPGINDQPAQLEEIAHFIANDLDKDVPWHVNRFFPAWKMMSTPVTPLETLKKAEQIGRDLGLTNIHIGNV